MGAVEFSGICVRAVVLSVSGWVCRAGCVGLGAWFSEYEWLLRCGH